jgi:hypothetical protein
MNRLYLQFTEFFDKHQWKHHQFGDQPVLHTHVHGEQGHWLGVAIAREEEEAIAFISLFPSVVPVNKRAVCAELLTRLNYNLKHGSFQMDMDDGEVRFITRLMPPTNEATPEQIEHLVFANVFTMDQRYDAIMKVIHGGASPKAVMAKQGKKEKQQKALGPKPRFEMN